MSTETLKDTLHEGLGTIKKIEGEEAFYNFRFGLFGKAIVFVFHLLVINFLFSLNVNGFLIFLIFIGYIGFLYKHLQMRKNSKIKAQSRIDNEYNFLFENYLYIPRDYCTEDTIKTFIKYLNNYRADDLKECIKLFHHEIDQEELKGELKKNTRAIKDVNRSTKSVGSGIDSLNNKIKY